MWCDSCNPFMAQLDYMLGLMLSEVETHSVSVCVCVSVCQRESVLEVPPTVCHQHCVCTISPQSNRQQAAKFT